MESVLLKLAKKLRDVGAVGRFDRAEHVDGRHVRAAECPVVGDFLDAGPGGGDSLGKLGQATGPIADCGREPAQPAVGHEAMLNHAAKHAQIDIAAGGT